MKRTIIVLLCCVALPVHADPGSPPSVLNTAASSDDRANLVIAGCAILESILDIWPAEQLGVADRGIREGILRSLMDRDGRAM